MPSEQEIEAAKEVLSREQLPYGWDDPFQHLLTSMMLLAAERVREQEEKGDGN